MSELESIKDQYYKACAEYGDCALKLESLQARAAQLKQHIVGLDKAFVEKSKIEESKVTTNESAPGNV